MRSRYTFYNNKNELNKEFDTKDLIQKENEFLANKKNMVDDIITLIDISEKAFTYTEIINMDLFTFDYIKDKYMKRKFLQDQKNNNNIDDN